MTKKITKKDILGELAKLAEKRPNRVQQACQYERYRKPHCVIGTVLHNLGVEPKTLRKMDKGDMLGINFTEPQQTLREAGFELTPAAVKVAARAQLSADMDAPWSEAYKAAKRVK
jgi:hypothetical protein